MDVTKPSGGEERKMSFNRNRDRAIGERRAGAERVEARIREETGDVATLEWSDLVPSGETYRLTVSVGRVRRSFRFSDEGLSDYPSGTAPHVDGLVEAAITWIRDQGL
jgi:transcriptional regulator of nitric oxide reductase